MRENSHLEFKEQVSDSFLKTVSAFSNYEGGVIIFGVNDSGNAIGIDNLKDEAIKIEHKINDSIKPQAKYDIEIDESKQMLYLTVHSGEEMPYFYKSKAYIRNDSSTIEVDENELIRLILQGQNKTYDSLANDVNHYEFNYLAEKFRKILAVEQVDNDVLKSLELINKDLKLTNAGYLLADHNKYKMLDIVRFGNDEDIILNRQQIKECSILQAYDKGIEIYRENYQMEKIDGAYRQQIELIPEKAFREALANALVHRDWMNSSYIQISMEDKAITITSPGGLPKYISEKEYLEGRISSMRNPIIGNILFRLDIIESFGTGIRRIKNSYSNSNKKPIFKVYANSIAVTLPLISQLEELTDDQEQVYLAIENKKLASSEISKITNFGKNKVIGILKELMDKGYAMKIGRGRGTKYISK